MQIEPLFQKGEKAFTITNLGGVFKLLEIEITGLVYQDFEAGKEPVYFYVFDMAPDESAKIEGAKAGQKVFGKKDDIFKTAEAAIAAIPGVMEANIKNFDENITSMESQVALIKAAKEKLIASAQDLTLSKLL
jgi:hypothetical protein